MSCDNGLSVAMISVTHKPTEENKHSTKCMTKWSLVLFFFFNEWVFFKKSVFSLI